MITNTKGRLVTDNDKVGIAKLDGIPIDIKGDARVKDVIDKMSQFGLITFSREEGFKSTHYTIHFIKPVEKLQQLYNLGDEVLILCCTNGNFEEFKSRTKDFLDKIVTSEYKNRLDKITCFLFDDCENIANLVKQDRIDNPDSRLIVPFSYSEVCDGLSEDFLQGRLRSFLYERDLFGVATPLQNDYMFFGKDRTNIISELYGRYIQGEHGGLFGLRRIGKTSILYLLQQKVAQANGVVKYFDCTKYHHLRWYQFLRQIIVEMIETSSEGESDDKVRETFVSDEYDEATANLSFESDLTHLFGLISNKRMLFIFDEIEQISYSTSPSAHWKSENDSLFFWQAIRSVYQTNPQLFSFVITGVNPKCIEDSKINGVDNPIFNILVPIFVPLFDLNDVKSMVSHIGGHIGLSFDEEIYTKLVDDYGGHPFLTRQVCSKINKELLEENQQRPYTVSKYTYDKRSGDYLKQMEAVLSQILGVLEDYYLNEYELLKILALDGSDAFKGRLVYGDSSISHLLGYCLVKKDANDYYINIKSIGNYLVQKHRYDKSLNNDDDRSSMISERRRKIENKLRELIAVNIQMKYGKRSRETLLKKLKGSTLDQTRETTIINAPDLTTAMEALYFWQLKILIEKDWADYQSMFGDKNKFVIFFDTINNFRKVDSHSNRISEEDYAIMKTALRFFEERLFI
ncbi:MAG: ATP-binding protein [Oscillospiraceae bacterium]|nr:ATP-binding protein [Oscillospiraceae bacterium]